MKPKGSQWRRQRLLKKEDIPSPESMVYTAGSLPTLTEAALFAMLYLTAGRVTEIVQCPFIRKNVYKRQDAIGKDGKDKTVLARNEWGSPIIERYDKVELNYPGLLKKDITFRTYQKEDGDVELMVVSMQNRKNKEFIRKNIPVTINKDVEMVALVKAYLDTLPELTSPLFPFGIRKAEHILSKTQYNPHFLRDIRLTHLVMLYNFNAFQLVKFAGWKDIKPAERYVRLGVGDIIY